MAKAQGANVTATAETADVALVQRLGADTVIDYRTQKFERIAQKTDVVIDTLMRHKRIAWVKVARPVER